MKILTLALLNHWNSFQFQNRPLAHPLLNGWMLQQTNQRKKENILFYS